MKKINIDNIELDSNVILAPMSGVTDLPYRNLVKSFGAALVVSEMVASRAMIASSRQSLQKSAIMTNDTTNSCVQLAGCDPETMSLAAKMNEDAGAKIIDINFGCPAKKIVGGFAGSALMRDEKLATKILTSVVKAVKTPVTLKMRMGWDDNSKNAVSLAKIAENEGIKMITIHGRTRCQFYTGKADWKFIKTVKDNVKIPVIANGDIVCFDTATTALKDSGADGIMIGRGAYGKPWLISQIIHFLNTGEKLPDPSLKKQYDTIIKHYDEMVNHYDNDSGIKIARKHISWYSSGMKNSAMFRAKINQTTDVNEVKNLITDLFDQEIKLQNDI